MNKDINNHQSDFDINEIWTAIEPRVDEINARRKKRKSVFLYWLFSGVGLLVGVISASLFFLSDKSQVQENFTPKQPSEIIQTIAPIQTSKKNHEIVLENDNSSRNLKEEIYLPTVSNTLSPTHESKNNSLKLNTDLEEEIPESILPTETNLSPNSSLTQEVQSIESTAKAIPPVVPQSYIAQRQTKVVPSKRILTIETNLGNIEKLPIADVEIDNPETDLPELNFSIKNNDSPYPLKGPKFSLEVQAGISAVDRSLTSTVDDSSVDTLLLLRNNLEETLEAVHLNLLLNAHFPSGFFVSSGLSYTKISELYFNNGTITETSTNQSGLQRQVIFSESDTVNINGPVVSTISTVFSTVNYNTFQFIDIPVFIGYQHDFGEWKTDVSLGVFTNILLTSKGRIPNSSTSLLNLESNGSEIYRNRVDFSYQLGVGVSKFLTKNVSIRINPSIRYYSKNLINENVGLSQKYLLAGGTIGLRLDL